MLTIYRLTMSESLAATAPSFDVTVGAVVIASSVEKARELVPCGDECHCGRGHNARIETCVWRCPELTEVTILGAAAQGVEGGLVMRDFNAG
jgi:hypothetical protein